MHRDDDNDDDYDDDNTHAQLQSHSKDVFNWDD